MKDWTAEPIDFKLWKRVPGNPFVDYDPAEGISPRSLWEMPSCAVGKLVRRGRPQGEPTSVRSVRLPTAVWDRLEAEARQEHTSVNAIVRKRVG